MPDFTLQQTGAELQGLINKISGLSAEIVGADEVIFQHSVQYASEPVSLFQKLEKGKTYLWKSTIPCNIEYYTADGEYVHLFDNETEVKFICPSDYDESQYQYITNPTGGKGTATISIKTAGLKNEILAFDAKVSELEKTTNHLGVSIDELTLGKAIVKKNLLYDSEPFKIFQELEKGKEYLFKSTIPCGIEYSTKDGEYVHLFDNETEVKFICPSDYDEDGWQYVRRYVSENGEMAIYGNAFIDQVMALVAAEIEVVNAEISELEGTLLNVGNILQGEDVKVFEGDVVAGGVTSHPIFQSLEKGKTYTFKANVKCNVEYYTANGGYAHLFDGKDNVEFVCPSDYDESKWQYVGNTEAVLGHFVVSQSGEGLTARVDNLTARVDNLAEQVASYDESIRTNTDAVQGQLKNYVAGVDYQKVIGAIRADGSVDKTASSFWYSSPIALKAGDIIRIIKMYAGVNGELWETDADNSYHKMLVKAKDGVKDITYIANRAMYINLNYLTGDNNYQVTILSGGVREERSESISLAIGKNRNAMPTDRPNKTISALKNAILVDDKAAAVNARFERQKMLNEVAAFKRKGVAPIKSGYCGYDDRGGSIVHNTISWEIYENGILYIYGYGKMYDYVKGICQGMNKAQLEARQDESPYLWYYFLVRDGVTYQEYDDNHNVMYTYPAPFPHRVYNEVEGEKKDADTGNYVGYAAPWYSFRSEIDFVDYTTPSHYYEFNPNRIYYDRICIDEDLTNGGITRIGDWAFYRATCDSLVLPSRLTEIGRWGVRYSPTIRTLVMENLVTTLEDHAISRMENMNHLIMSDAVTSIDFYGLAQNDLMRAIDLPSVSFMTEYAVTNNLNLESVEIGNNLAELRKMNLTPCRLIRHLELPNGMQSVGEYVGSVMELESLHLPSSITNISNTAFDGASIHSLYLNNTYTQTLVSSLSAFKNAAYVFIKEGVKVDSYILSNYDFTGIHDGYKRYEKRLDL